MALKVGTIASPELLALDAQTRGERAQDIVDRGIDHVFIADHISFFNGMGMDGLINAATLTAAHPRLTVCVGVYLLALRHPVTVARQLATLASSAPGRLILGVGVGGEDRNEVAMCGVDPATRGKRTNECLQIIQALMKGERLDFHGEFFDFERALILPAPSQPIPVLVGGRSDAAVDRAARYADGWLGVWCSPKRFAEVLATIEAHPASAARTTPRSHGLQLWAGVDDNAEHARARLARGMENFYQTSFERFARYSPWGKPKDIADFLLPYREAGCELFNIMPIAESDQAGVEAVAEIRRMLL